MLCVFVLVFSVKLYTNKVSPDYGVDVHRGHYLLFFIVRGLKSCAVIAMKWNSKLYFTGYSVSVLYVN